MRRTTLSRDMADDLCREIRQKRLGPGTPLGTEADLAERQDHVMLADAFAARDVAAAVRIMSDHIQPMLKHSP